MAAESKTIILYSSDFHGVGHFTRNLKIAKFLSKINKNYIFYIITNAYVLTKKIPKNIKIVLMPELKIKKVPRECRYLKKVLPEVESWSKFLIEKIKEINPNLFYSDLNPCGGYGELRNVFPELKNMKINTTIGLRDILDGVSQTKKEWMNGKPGMVSIYNYDEILVYGEKKVFYNLYRNIIQQKNKFRFVGYMIPPRFEKDVKKSIDIFAMFGGGGESLEQVTAIAELLSASVNKKSVLVTGPLFPRAEHERLISSYKNIKFISSTKNIKAYLLRSKLIITHCGYNSVTESLLYNNNVLIFPRRRIRKEQQYRAMIFKKLGYCDYIDLSEPAYKNINKILFHLNNYESIKNKKINSGMNKHFVAVFKSLLT